MWVDVVLVLVVVVGIGGVLFGWLFFDLLVVVLMGFMILCMGVGLVWGVIKELIDIGFDEI